MWLDRLSQSTVAGQPGNGNRAGSPLPRRPSGQGRGPYMTSQRPPRGSSLSLVSNDSNTSLLAANRKQNGSALKQSTTVDADEDKAKEAAALVLLGKLLGDDSAGGNDADAAAKSAKTTKTTAITDEDLELDFDFGGLSLRELAWDGPPLNAREATHSSRTREELDRDQSKFEDLHKSIQACDEVLNSVETNLTSFRNDLALVSADIENLQARSTALNVRLDNRKAVEKGLAAAVEDLSVSPVLVNKIAEGHIDEQWVQCLRELDRRAANLRSASGKAEEEGGSDSDEDDEDEVAVAPASPTLQRKAYLQQHQHQQQQPRPTKAAADLLPLLEKLINKAVERIRDFLVAQIKALRSPHINAQVIQQQGFLKFKDLYTFLHRHHPTLANEIGQAYRNTMRWYYSNQFSRYGKSLEKLKLHTLDKNDVLGHDEHLSTSSSGGVASSALSGAFGGKSSSRGASSGPPHDAFSLGRRIDLLKGPNLAAMPSYLAEESAAGGSSGAAATTTTYLEVPFRHFNLALVDNATAEYTFLASFFSPALTYATIARHFNYIFEPTFALGQTLTRTLTAETYDCLGVLLCIRLNQHFAFELQRRKVPAVDGYINATNMLLWPRFQVIMDHHCESMHHLAGNVPTSLSSTAATASAAPHVVTQRFGQLLHGILALSTEAGDDEPVVTSLHRLRSEVEAFLTKYSQAAFGRGNNVSERRKRERFLYNNYSLVLTIISDVHGGKLTADQKQHIETLKSAFQEGA